jgi:hypothetical protein
MSSSGSAIPRPLKVSKNYSGAPGKKPGATVPGSALRQPVAAAEN